jgi:hypothetical protein
MERGKRQEDWWVSSGRGTPVVARARRAGATGLVSSGEHVVAAESEEAGSGSLVSPTAAVSVLRYSTASRPTGRAPAATNMRKKGRPQRAGTITSIPETKSV